MDIEQKVAKKHVVNIVYGESVEIRGIVCALEYDENIAIFKLVDNVLTIHGSGFDIKALDIDSGVAIVSGTVSSLEYSKSREKQGFFKRIMKWQILQTNSFSSLVF